MPDTKRRLFGTDGVRGIANRYPLDSQTAVRLGQAAATIFRDAPGLNRIVIGKDTRLSGYLFENALVSGICSMGMDAMFVGPLPTPGIAFIASSMRAKAGIMVSASHNPIEYNGIKFFDHKGFKLSDERELEMEKLIFEDKLDAMRAAPELIGRAFRIDDAAGRYIQYVKGTLPQNLSLDGLKIVIDCANGAGYKVGPSIFSELGAVVTTTAVQPNGLNINLDCGALHPDRMAKLVRENGADIGIALDGDADRVIMCDENGSIIDGDAILAICALHLNAKGKLARSTVVGTSMTNMGLEVMLKENGIELVRTDVGDRYVIDEMRREGYVLGGETSGHIIFLDHTTSGDGILAALRVLSVMCQKNEKLSELAKTFSPYPQIIVNVKVRERREFESMPHVQKRMNDAKEKLAGRGRILVRYSGTENIARVMVEGENRTAVEIFAKSIADEIKAEIGVL